MTYDQWIEKYKPVQNHIDTNAAFNGWMFETYGEEYAHIRKTVGRNYRITWTIIEGDDDNMYVVDGVHVVNRFGYFVTEVARTDDEFHEILIN